MSFAERDFICKDENKLDKKLANEPNNYLLLTAKAECLLNRNEDGSALEYLHLGKGHGGVYSAYLIAYYLETDGTFEALESSLRNSEVLDPTVRAYQEVLSLIATIPDYPPESEIDYTIYESTHHLRIDTLYTISRLYFNRYLYQMIDHNSHLLKNSPSFETSKVDMKIKFFPNVAHYMGPLYSLNQLQASAQNCINTPYIKYWNREKYDRYIKICEAYKNFVDESRSLENERIQKSEVCKDFISLENAACKEYGDLGREILKKRKVVNEIIKELDF